MVPESVAEKLEPKKQTTNTIYKVFKMLFVGS